MGNYIGIGDPRPTRELAVNSESAIRLITIYKDSMRGTYKQWDFESQREFADFIGHTRYCCDYLVQEITNNPDIPPATIMEQAIRDTENSACKYSGTRLGLYFSFLEDQIISIYDYVISVPF